VIEVFYSVVSEYTSVAALTDLPTALGHVLAQFRGVVEGWATAIPLVNIVVVPALLTVVGSCDAATLRLERHQINKYYAIPF
jgi:hypothetical protein